MYTSCLFPISFLVGDWLASQLVYFLNNLFNFSNTSSGYRRQEVLLRAVLFYQLLADKENTLNEESLLKGFKAIFLRLFLLFNQSINQSTIF